MFDLQRFAAVTNTTASEGLSPEMKTYYDKQLIRKSDPYLVHNQFGQKRPIPKGGGKTIEFRTFTSLPKATVALTEGVTPDGRALEVENLTATVDQYGDYVKITDMVDLTAVDPVLTESQELLASQAGRTLDTITREVVNAGTNVLYAGGAEQRSAMTDENVLKLEDVFAAAAILKAANARPFEGGFVAVIHPYIAYDLMTEAKASGSWIDINKYTNVEKIFAGELGKVAGVRFVESSEAKIWKGEDLASDARTLAVNHSGGYTGATSVVVDGGTFAASALVGRYVIIGGTKAKVTANTASSGTSTLTLDTAVTCADNETVYPGEGASGGGAVFSTLVIGKDAYGVTEVEGGGLEMIVKPFGAGEDALNQRCTAGWKATAAAEILSPEYMVRIESCSPKFGARAAAN